MTPAPLKQPTRPCVEASFRICALAAAGLIGLFAICATASAREDIAGVWYDDSGRGAVELTQCGDNFCGRIVWLEKMSARNGRPLRDANNPDQNRRQRPICGLPVIWGLQPQQDGTWDEGYIYDPKVGKSYNVAITRLSDRQLRITGYVGTKLFSRNLIWQRAPNGLERCQKPG